MVAGIQGYRELSRHLQDQIERGVYAAGERMPTETAMSETYGMNRHTVRAALQLLENGGYINRVRGKGTFVTRRKIPYAISPSSSFTASLEKLGYSGSCRVLQARVQPAPADAARCLDLPAGAEVVALEILRSIDDAPICITTSCLPRQRFPDLCEAAWTMDSLYRLLRTRYAVTGIRRVWSEIEAAMPSVADRDLLQMPVQMPLLITRSLARDGRATLLEYCVSRHRSDAYTLRVDLEPHREAEQ